MTFIIFLTGIKYFFFDLFGKDFFAETYAFFLVDSQLIIAQRMRKGQVAGL